MGKSLIVFFWSFIMRVFLIFFAFLFFTAGAEVFFVPGWRTGFDGRDGCVRILKDAYPGKKITVKSWDSLQSWDVAKKNAGIYTGKLLAEILEMPDERREQLIMVGHSIGARIVVDILSELSRRKLKIHSMALLAAALPDNDPRIGYSLDAIRFYCCNVYNPEDWILKYLFAFDNQMHAPLGLCGWAGKDYRLFERKARSDRFGFANHFAYIYLEELDRMLETLPPEYPKVDVPQDLPNKVRRPADMVYWETVKSFGNWRLQKYIPGNDYRILDDRGNRRAQGSKEKITQAFDEVCRQLEAVK